MVLYKEGFVDCQLYHWSPSINRNSIRENGLKINQAPRCHTEAVDYLCFTRSPGAAWSLSGKLHGEPGELWDCWIGYYPARFRTDLSTEIRIYSDLPNWMNLMAFVVRIHKKGDSWMQGIR